MTRVYIVDDHKMVIEGLQLSLQKLPDLKIVGTAISGEIAIEEIPNKEVDVVLLDINLPGMNGVETCKKLIELQPNLKIISISMHKEMSLIKLMLKNGAKGYVLKNAGTTEITNAIRSVMDGNIYLEEEVNNIILNDITHSKTEKEKSLFPKLSRREKEVLNCILEELTTQEIADKLFISFGTVETHRRNMFIKTGAKNIAGLVRIALEYGLNE